jgi:hypothetical protein
LAGVVAELEPAEGDTGEGAVDLRAAGGTFNDGRNAGVGAELWGDDARLCKNSNDSYFLERIG